VPPEPTEMLSPLNVEDIEAVLNEMLPIVSISLAYVRHSFLSFHF